MKKRTIQSVWLTGLLLLLGLVTGCSEQSEPDVPQGKPLQIRSLTRSSSVQLTEGVRILIAPLLLDGTEAQAGYVTYAGKINGKDTWNSGVYVDLVEKYWIYGYMPSSVVGDYRIAATKSGNTVVGSSLTLKGVAALSNEDLCVVIGVGDGEAPADVERGNFAYTPDLDSESGLIKGISLLMDHLFAAANFQMKIDPEYNKLRTIKLKRLALKCHAANKGDKVDVTITFRNGQENPISSISTTDVQNNQTAELVLFEDANGIALEEETSIIDETKSLIHLIPSFATSLSLVSTYDVYDKKGNRIRENCQATNSLSLVLGGITRGQIRPVVLTVKPTYLYMLSEPDLENPTLDVNNE
jgi:hypothetical protein